MTREGTTATAPQTPEPDDRAEDQRAPAADVRWWRDAVVYQVYVRSFSDANGDGIGDLAGVRERLPYLRDLGVDALWFNPWYPSPMADTGYDIADYRAIDPAFGTLQEAQELIAEARALGIRTIVDIVPNHVSSQHPWFREAIASPPGSPARDRFWFRPGTGADGELPPNNWQSIFGGPAWTRVEDGEWYLHLFAPEQPDLNWTHREVWHEHEDVLRFWFDRGVAGVRIDSAALLVKDPELAEEPPDGASGEHPFMDRDTLHDIYRRWRGVADGYAEPRVLVG
jgi:alpha-glucosidase